MFVISFAFCLKRAPWAIDSKWIQGLNIESHELLLYYTFFLFNLIFILLTPINSSKFVQ